MEQCLCSSLLHGELERKSHAHGWPVCKYARTLPLTECVARRAVVVGQIALCCLRVCVARAELACTRQNQQGLVSSVWSVGLWGLAGGGGVLRGFPPWITYASKPTQIYRTFTHTDDPHPPRGGPVYAWNRYDLANWRSYSRTEHVLGQSIVILGRFALRFQWKSLVHFCATDGLLARLVLWDMFCVFQHRNQRFGHDDPFHQIALKTWKCGQFPRQSANLLKT